MIKTYTYKNLNWIDIESPTSKDVSELIKKYDIHPLVGEELLRPTKKSKVDVYSNYIYLALHIPIRSNINSKSIVVEKEIDFIIGNNFIVTVRNEIIEPLHVFAKSFETNSILDKNKIGDHAGIIFYFMMKKIYNSMSEDLENIKDALNDAEEHVFIGDEKKVVRVLSELSRELIDFKQTSRLHKDVFESFKNIPENLFGNTYSNLIEDLRDEYAAVHELVASNRELLNDLRDTNDSLLSTKQNESMKLFSVLAFVTFPLTLFLDLFMLPTSHIPLIGYRYDWEILAGIVLIAAISMFTFFKKKGWL